mmetsp:Transcript_16871/g.53446  ORF Transcript_16871/g.53446 Transcript_16871/m.53446 type:complete len:130 (-) Transcript_16871:202-591(-)
MEERLAPRHQWEDRAERAALVRAAREAVARARLEGRLERAEHRRRAIHERVAAGHSPFKAAARGRSFDTVDVLGALCGEPASPTPGPCARPKGPRARRQRGRARATPANCLPSSGTSAESPWSEWELLG